MQSAQVYVANSPIESFSRDFGFLFSKRKEKMKIIGLCGMIRPIQCNSTWNVFINNSRYKRSIIRLDN